MEAAKGEEARGVVLWFPRDTASPLWVSRKAGEMLGIHGGGPHVARSFVILIFMVIFVFYLLNRF